MVSESVMLDNGSGDRPQGLPTICPLLACPRYDQFKQCESPLLTRLATSQNVLAVCSFHPSNRQSLHSIINSVFLTAIELPPRSSHLASGPETGRNAATIQVDGLERIFS